MNRAGLLLMRREIVRVLRQPTRIAVAVLTALVLWVLAASGLGDSFARPGIAQAGGVVGEVGGYGVYLLPGMMLMVILFSSVFSAMSLIEDRHEGFLQSVLVSPAGSGALVLSKIGGGAVVALSQALVLLPAGLFAGVTYSPMGVLGVVLAGACASASIVALGLVLAWRVDSTAGFHGVMNLVLMPMWLLSGALFPVEGSSLWLAVVVRLNPAHWMHRAMEWSLRGAEAGDWVVGGWGMCIATPIVLIWVALFVFGRSGGKG